MGNNIKDKLKELESKLKTITEQGTLNFLKNNDTDDDYVEKILECSIEYVPLAIGHYISDKSAQKALLSAFASMQALCAALIFEKSMLKMDCPKKPKGQKKS